MLAFSVIKLEQFRARQSDSAKNSAPPQRAGSIASKLADSTAVGRATQERLLAPDIRPQFLSNCAKLNRQTQEIEHPVTYRKQTTANSSNRQKIQKWACAFSVPSCARVTKRSASVVSLTPPRVAATLPHRHLWGRTNLRVSGFAWIIGMTAAAALACGCAVSR